MTLPSGDMVHVQVVEEIQGTQLESMMNRIEFRPVAESPNQFVSFNTFIFN